MARRVRDFDWSRTCLGPRENWPLSLKLIAETMLATGFPMAVRWGPKLVFLYNDAYRAILGNKHPDALGRSLREVWPEIYDELGPLNEGILRAERPAFFKVDQRWRVERGSGPEDARFTISYSPIPDPTAPHGIGGILTTCVETTDRVVAEDEMRQLNERLEEDVALRTRERDRIWLVSEDLLGVSNFEGFFLSVNPAWTRLLGWSEDEIRGIHVDDLRHPDDLAHSHAQRARLAAGVPTVRMENRFRHKDGTWRWMYWTLTAESGLIYIIGRHVTAEREAADALRRAEEQLAQSRKMEALGQLTGGIAHDFNNLLMVVIGNAQLLRRHPMEPATRRLVDAIELAAERGENLTRQLRAFSRRQPLNPTVIRLGERLQAARDLLTSSARGDIELRLDVPDDIWPVSVDVPELELAVVNLVVNARDAIAGSGRIAIDARNLRLDAGDTPDELAGEFVALCVSDSGSGVPPQFLSKVFEPFFSTKQIDKGTGLGLSQVYGFTRQSGGTVTIANQPEGGAIVTLYLPRADAAVGEQEQETATAEGAVSNERILLVEDNEDVREVAIMLLDQLGYRVLPVENGAAALAVLDKGEVFDLVFSDIVMPGEPNGLDLARHIRKRHPSLPILLTTGYAQAEANAGSEVPILRKPYRLNTLGQALRTVLGSGGSPTALL